MGDTIPEKGPDTLRVYSQNINGISMQQMEDDFHYKLHQMALRQVDITGWAETNIEWNDHSVNKELFAIMKRHFPGGAWKPSTSNIPMPTNYKPGGNLMVLGKNIRSRTTIFKKDSMGRWVWAVIQGRTESIAIIQAYVPGSNKGIMSTFAQQYQQIQKRDNIGCPDVMREFYKDLHTLLTEVAPAKIILMGDFNQEPESDVMLELQSIHHLQDAYGYYHPGSETNTHKQGTRRIDFILMSPALLPMIQNIGYESFDSGIISDHRGMYVDLNLKVLQTNQDMYSRRMKSNQSTRVKKYRKKLHKKLMMQRIPQQIRKLGKIQKKEWTSKHTNKLLCLDRVITKAMLDAERKCLLAHTAPWSPVIQDKYEDIKHIKKKDQKTNKKNYDPMGANTRTKRSRDSED